VIAAAAIAAAFQESCRDEIEAPKPGNVHAYAPGHGMVAEEFLLSAHVAAPHLAESGRRPGARILGAVEATFAAVGKNTNLGILLLCGPLAAAADMAGSDLRKNLNAVLQSLDRNDTQNVFAAIQRARPAGLGSASRHDVHGPAEADLREVMAEAAPRDRIALQYVSTFHDIFVTGLAALQEARANSLAPPWTTLYVYLTFLAAFPDTHVTRKCGSAAALEVQCKGQEILQEMLRAMRVEFETRRASFLDDLLTLDGEFKARNLNPGTSADLTVATLFADRLRTILLQHRNDG
jgi:triphosphoribosyl-dephospho-CoA synthase